MYRIYGILIGIAAAAVFIIPIFFVYEKCIFNNKKRTLLYTVFAFYLVAVLTLVGFPDIMSLTLDFAINVIPFADIISDFKNACLNVLLFIPLGIFLPVLWDKYRNAKNTIIFGLCATGAIEVAQIFTFRTTDINDVITNIAGTLVGYLITKGITKKFTRYTMPNTKSKDLYIICATVIIVMFFMQPLIASLLWEAVL